MRVAISWTERSCAELFRVVSGLQLCRINRIHLRACEFIDEPAACHLGFRQV